MPSIHWLHLKAVKNNYDALLERNLIDMFEKKVIWCHQIHKKPAKRKFGHLSASNWAIASLQLEKSDLKNFKKWKSDTKRLKTEKMENFKKNLDWAEFCDFWSIQSKNFH